MTVVVMTIMSIGQSFNLPLVNVSLARAPVLIHQHMVPLCLGPCMLVMYILS